MKKTKESGRSMVEMLGVLAIIGVLSVGGIAGYTTAMNKHRANKILNGASVRAIVVSTQIQRGSAAPTLGEFTDNEVGGARLGTGVQNADGTATWTTTDKRFSLTLTGVNEDICTQMKAMKGENGIIKAIADDCTTITYNNDLTATTFITDNKDSTSCESAGGAWNEATKTCGCPGRYTGSNCEIAPTTCPSETTPTEGGKCKWCTDEGDCVVCEKEEEVKCADLQCGCYNPKTENAKCGNFACKTCEIKSDTPDVICAEYGSCICYNKNTQNVKCGNKRCGTCEIKSDTPDVICAEHGSCICYNKNTQNAGCNNSYCKTCELKSDTSDVICPGYGDCICYNKNTQNVTCNDYRCGTCEIKSDTPIARCEDNGTCSCVAE